MKLVQVQKNAEKKNIFGKRRERREEEDMKKKIKKKIKKKEMMKRISITMGKILP